jgi:hypothetical protein
VRQTPSQCPSGIGSSSRRVAAFARTQERGPGSRAAAKPGSGLYGRGRVKPGLRLRDWVGGAVWWWRAARVSNTRAAWGLGETGGEMRRRIPIARGKDHEAAGRAPRARARHERRAHVRLARSRPRALASRARFALILTVPPRYMRGAGLGADQGMERRVPDPPPSPAAPYSRKSSANASRRVGDPTVRDVATRRAGDVASVARAGLYRRSRHRSRTAGAPLGAGVAGRPTTTVAAPSPSSAAWFAAARALARPGGFGCWGADAFGGCSGEPPSPPGPRESAGGLVEAGLGEGRLDGSRGGSAAGRCWSGGCSGGRRGGSATAAAAGGSADRRCSPAAPSGRRPDGSASAGEAGRWSPAGAFGAEAGRSTAGRDGRASTAAPLELRPAASAAGL